MLVLVSYCMYGEYRSTATHTNYILLAMLVLVSYCMLVV